MISTELQQLQELLRPRISAGVALAFSGGVDSTVLLKVLVLLREEKPFPLVACTVVTPFSVAGEATAAGEFAQQCQVEWRRLPFDPLTLPQVRANDRMRCYWCKRGIFQLVAEEAATLGVKAILDGTNQDDHREYRPGLKALQELGVFSPIAAAGMGKKQLRAIAAELGLPCANRPSAPCMATRFEYDMPLDETQIRQVEQGEAILKRFLPVNTPCRVRVHRNGMVRLEVPPALQPMLLYHREQLLHELQQLGWRQITLDLLGFRSGSWDER